MEVTFTIKMNAQEVQRAIESGILAQLAQGAIAQEELDTVRREETKDAVVEDKPVVEKPETPLPYRITLEDVRAAFVEKNSKDNSATLKAILEQHGVSKISDLDEDDYPSVLQALEAV